MDQKSLQKIRLELDAMRRRMIKPAEMQSLAARLGRKLVKRGKHPNWESEMFPLLPALSIPDHGSRDLSKFVRGKSLTVLEQDIEMWEGWLKKNDGSNGAQH